MRLWGRGGVEAGSLLSQDAVLHCEAIRPAAMGVFLGSYSRVLIFVFLLPSPGMTPEPSPRATPAPGGEFWTRLTVLYAVVPPSLTDCLLQDVPDVYKRLKQFSYN